MAYVVIQHDDLGIVYINDGKISFRRDEDLNDIQRKVLLSRILHDISTTFTTEIDNLNCGIEAKNTVEWL